MPDAGRPRRALRRGRADPRFRPCAGRRRPGARWAGRDADAGDCLPGARARPHDGKPARKPTSPGWLKRQKKNGIYRRRLELQLQELGRRLAFTFKLRGGAQPAARRVEVLQLDADTTLRLPVAYARSEQIVAGLPALIKAVRKVSGKGFWLIGGPPS